MRFNRYSDKGRTLMVEFRCQRCGVYKTEPLEEVCKRSPDSYDYLRNLSVPKDWSDNFYGWMLCPECTKKLLEFMKMKDGADNGKT